MFGLTVASLILLSWLSLLYVPFRWRPVGIFLIVEKALALAYAPFIVVVAIALMVVGALVGSWWAAVAAGIAAVGALAVVVRVGSVRTDLSGALGPGWSERIPAGREATMLSARWTGRLPSSTAPRLRRDVPFATVPGTDRALLCDVWQPPVGVAPSGVALVYLHGSAYYFLDKDCATRPLFQHLAAQGHVIVDVAYRLFPETDVVGMVADAKRAIAWMRGHAADLEIDPERIVLIGGSAGGHLSLLTAYGHDAPELTPPDLIGTDLRVFAVASLYGQVGLDTLYEHTSQHEICHSDDPRPNWDAPPSRALVRLFGHDAARLRLQFMTFGGRCDWLVGGTPSEVPDRYAQVSVISYIRSDCPPTLLMHGTHDEMAPVAAVRQLQRRLEQAGVPVTAVYLPHTDHMFDLVGTKWSPAARVTIHVLERFLAAISVGETQRRPVLSPSGETRGTSAEAWAQPLLLCGIVSSFWYAAMLVFVPLAWPSYSSAAHTVSELSAIGAPTRVLWVSLATVWSALYIAFGAGVRLAGSTRTLRTVGSVVVAAGIFGLFWPPMHLREVLAAGGGTVTDTLHIVWTAGNGVLTLLAMGLGAAALDRPFRRYSIATMLILIAAGALTSREAPGVDANLPTPWIGVWERINIGAWLLWVLVLAVALLRRTANAGSERSTHAAP